MHRLRSHSDFLAFPDELLEALLRWCVAGAIVSVAATCRRLRALSKDVANRLLKELADTAITQGALAAGAATMMRLHRLCGRRLEVPRAFVRLAVAAHNLASVDVAAMELLYLVFGAEVMHLLEEYPTYLGFRRPYWKILSDVVPPPVNGRWRPSDMRSSTRMCTGTQLQTYVQAEIQAIDFRPSEKLRNFLDVCRGIANLLSGWGRWDRARGYGPYDLTEVCVRHALNYAVRCATFHKRQMRRTRRLMAEWDSALTDSRWAGSDRVRLYLPHGIADTDSGGDGEEE
ncbi:hypothetical protein OAO87_02115 [bacterium]|nr:hypothetical protein [bacterium]